jgi:Holliday junction resolvasome RuvABC ATP-dependent DNA helicase subunit
MMRVFMKFLHLHLFHKAAEFGNIEGYDDIKFLVRRALDSDENYNLLLCGPPASAKTLFLLEILVHVGKKKGAIFDGSNTTNRILDVLEEERPKVICIDELDKMSCQFQNQLLNFLDSGRIKVDQQRKSYDFEIKDAKVFATCNEINRLSKPLQSRFRRLQLPPYTEEQFLDIAVKICPKLKEISRIIGEEVWKTSKDVRDVVSLSKLIRKRDGPDEIEAIMRTFTKYSIPT